MTLLDSSNNFILSKYVAFQFQYCVKYTILGQETLKLVLDALLFTLLLILGAKVSISKDNTKFCVPNKLSLISLIFSSILINSIYVEFSYI